MAEPDPRSLPHLAGAPSLQRVRVTLARALLWASAAGCAVAAGLIGVLVPASPAATGMMAFFGILALASALATRVSMPWLGVVLLLLQTAIAAGIAVTGPIFGWGARSPGVPIIGLMVCVLCAAAGWRAGAALAALALAAVLALGGAAPASAGPPLALELGTYLIAIAAGLAAGLLIARRLARTRHAANERETRFRRLLALAADGYWEIDREYRIVAASGSGGAMRQMSARSGLGSVPWELPQFGCDADALDRMRADLDARLPFRDLAVHWRARVGQVRELRVSGEPRFDERGVFAGYWGVVRDVTEIQAAQAALAATETRYHELFSRIPTPLVLHRSGRVIDANAAALALFGQPDLQSMLGRDLFDSYEEGDSRERARQRMGMLQAQPLGTALPVTDFRLVPAGRVVSVRATSASVDAVGGPATLAIFVDDTERLAAEEAVRRSEAMLSHLVATSPDLISLTELVSGRYAMVNRSFERLTGWSAAEVVGRSALEMGTWGSAQAREDLVRRVREEGAVADLPMSFVSKAGVGFSMIVSAARFTMDRREYMVVNARDVTEKERQRQEREAILLNASIGIAVTRQRHFVLVNRHFEQLYGWAGGELDGQAAVHIWRDAAEYEEIGALVTPNLERGEPVELERVVRRKDGSGFLARIRGHAVDLRRPSEGGTVWIVEDVTERRQAEAALARARDDAEAANRAKSAFLANTSHELRTPLNGLLGMARLARQPDLATERRNRYMEQIAQCAQALAGIISDILDLSKIEAGKLLIESAAFDLGGELRALQAGHEVMAAARGLALRFELAPELGPAVQGDPLRVRQIVSNFLANAIKFTAAGSVCLRARRLTGERREWVRLEVQDSGPGIAAATLARLFKPFTQADESTTRRYGGTGLGLSICHELATLMGGAVGADSQFGAGSSFWVELPLPVVPLPALQPLALLPSAALRGARVLMVEDNPVNMLIAVAMLERWGVQVAQAADGREAVAAVQRAVAVGQPFHTVLMDVQMPLMSGHEATRTLRELEASGALPLPALPVVALTAAALVSEREEALRSGMNDFLTKPIDAAKLHAALLRWYRIPA